MYVIFNTVCTTRVHQVVCYLCIVHQAVGKHIVNGQSMDTSCCSIMQRAPCDWCTCIHYQGHDGSFSKTVTTVTTVTTTWNGFGMAYLNQKVAVNEVLTHYSFAHPWLSPTCAMVFSGHLNTLPSAKRFIRPRQSCGVMLSRAAELMAQHGPTSTRRELIQQLKETPWKNFTSHFCSKFQHGINRD